MAGPSPLFDITIWMERTDDPAAVHDALVEALGEQSPLLARGVRSTERGVAVEFPEMKGCNAPVVGDAAPFVINLYVENADQTYDRAVKAGAKAKMYHPSVTRLIANVA